MFSSRVAGPLSAIFLLFVIVGCDKTATDRSSPGTAKIQASLDAHLPALSLTVYKSPSCGCCKQWIAHLEEAGVATVARHPADMAALKEQHQIDGPYQSCHTAVSKEGYVFEGHVPARFIQQFLANPPTDAIGLAVPGMPVGSPGMEVRNQFTPYEVLLLKQDGSAEVFVHVSELSQQYQEPTP